MRTYKYPIRKHPKNKRLGNHAWTICMKCISISTCGSVSGIKTDLRYANYHAMSAHLTELKKTTHPHWKSLPSQVIQCELKRIHTQHIKRFFNKLGGRPHIKAKHKFKSITFPGQAGIAGWQIEDKSYHYNLP